MPLDHNNRRTAMYLNDRARMWILSSLISLGMLACHQPTQILLLLEPGPSTPPGIRKIELAVNLDGTLTSSTISGPDGGDIKLPVTTSLVLDHGGTVSIHASAEDQGGKNVDQGDAMTTVAEGDYLTVHLPFGQK